MINHKNREECCGCTACVTVCNAQALTMQADGMGFKYPKFDVNKCTNCGQCEKVCAFQFGYNIKENLITPDIYAVRHKRMSEIETSRSGAMFIALSDYILGQGGVIYGAGYKEHFVVSHKRATTKVERNEFKGSKYVQSDLDDIFTQVKEDLRDGLQVLFSGTPCQTAALHKVVPTKYRNKLLLVDIVCHGVPAPKVWYMYLEYIKNKYSKTIEKVNFRDKSIGWATHKESFILHNQQKIFSDTYTFLFSKHIILRPSCGNCKYCNITRPADITLADYWGWEKTDRNFNADNKGCSLVFVNTPKGKSYWEYLKDNINYIPTEITKCLQPNLQHPSVLSEESDNFEKLFIQKGFKAVALRYGNTSIRYKLVAFSTKIKRKLIKLIK